LLRQDRTAFVEQSKMRPMSAWASASGASSTCGMVVNCIASPVGQALLGKRAGDMV
jgi:hypothetical protein